MGLTSLQNSGLILRHPLTGIGAVIFAVIVVWFVCRYVSRYERRQAETQDGSKRRLQKVALAAEIFTFFALLGAGHTVSNAIFDHVSAVVSNAKMVEERSIQQLAHEMTLGGNCWYSVPEEPLKSGINLSEFCAIARAFREFPKPDLELSNWMGRIDKEKLRASVKSFEYKVLSDLLSSLDKWEKSDGQVRLNESMKNQRKSKEDIPWVFLLALFFALSACSLKLGKAFAELRFIK